MTALEVVPQSMSVLGTQSQLDLLKTTIASGLTDGEFELFAAVCQRTGLDPFVKQIYAVKRYSSTEQRKVMTIQVGIDGYRLIADRTGKCAGIDDAIYTGTTGDGYPDIASVTVYKIVGGQRCPFAASARWVEYVPAENQATMWRKMPHVMLGKVAEALALRKAFPAELSGFYTSEEMAQADVTIAPLESVQVEPAVPSFPEGFENLEAAKDAHAAVRTKIAELTEEQRVGLAVWREENGLSGFPLPLTALTAVESHVEELLACVSDVDVAEPVVDSPTGSGATPPDASDPAPSLPSLDTFDGDAAPKDPLTRMTRAELVEQCESRDLATDGDRKTLITRIVERDSEPF